MVDRAVGLYMYHAAFFNIHDPNDVIALSQGFEDGADFMEGILFQLFEMSHFFLRQFLIV